MEQKYDAFISYKHGDLDGAIALKLQTLLEHLRIPSSSKQKAKKIERIFLDTGELSSSADFVQQVEGALKNAEWLIVLCSPGSKSSPWCKLEIDTFLKYHDMSHILLLLTEGEPDDVFPDRLLAEEMNSLHILAADARGKTKKEALNNLKKEAVYKLAATMLGLTYDDLKQRRKAYVMQRIAAFSAAACLILACFTGYIIYQSGQITINFNKAQKNQARYMTTVSNAALASGDRDAAILTANAILPKHVEDGPLVPEQFYSLNRALGSYKLYNEYLPSTKIETGHTTSYTVTENEKYSCALQVEKFTVLDNTSEEISWTLTKQEVGALAKPYLENHKDQLFPDNLIGDDNKECHIQIRLDNFTFKGMQTYKENQVFVYSDSLLLLVDVEKKSLIYSHDINSSKLSFSGDRIVIAESTDRQMNVSVYDATSFQQIQTIDFGDLLSSDDETVPSIGALEISQDGKFAAISFYLNAIDAFNNRTTFIGTVLFDLDTGEKTVMSEEYSSSIFFFDQNTISMIQEADSPDQGDFDDFDDRFPKKYLLCLYDIPSRKMTLSKEWKDALDTNQQLIHKMNLRIQGEVKNFILFCLNGDLILIDPDSRLVHLKLYFHNDIVDVEKVDDTAFYVALTTGHVQVISLLDDMYYSENYCLLDTEIKSYTYLEDAYKFLFFTSDHAIFCENEMDPYYKEMDLLDSKKYKTKNVEYITGKDSTWRVLNLESRDEYGSYKAFTVYKTGEVAPLYSWEAGDGYQIQNLQLRELDGRLQAVWIESCKNEDFSYTNIMHKADLSTGEELFAEKLEDYCNRFTCYAFSDDLSSVLLNKNLTSSGTGLVQLDLSGNGVVEEKTDLFTEYRFDALVKAGDGKRCLLIGEGEDDITHAWVYDSETEELKETPFTAEEGLYSYSTVTPGRTGSLMFVKLSENASYILDTKDPEHPISLGADIESSAAFFDQDRYLIYIRNEVLYLYDIEEQKDFTSYQAPDHSNISLERGRIITDSSSEFFALNKPDSISMSYTNDEGMLLSPMYTFYVDKNKNIYLYSSSQSTYISPAGKEITVSAGDTAYYTSLYSYAELCDHAKEILGDKTLSDAELQALLMGE